MTKQSEPYQLFDSLPDEQYAALKADIARNGVQVAVEVDENGNLLDGHHRVRAWKELRAEGVDLPDYPTVTRCGLSEEAKHEHVLKANLLRRHLGPMAWAEAFTRLAKVRRIRLDKQGRQKGKTDTMAVLAEEVGASPRTVRRWLRDAKLVASQPDLAAEVNRGYMGMAEALRQVKSREHVAAVGRQRAVEREADRQREQLSWADEDMWTSVPRWLDRQAEAFRPRDWAGELDGRPGFYTMHSDPLWLSGEPPTGVLDVPRVAEALAAARVLHMQLKAGVAEREAALRQYIDHGRQAIRQRLVEAAGGLIDNACIHVGRRQVASDGSTRHVTDSGLADARDTGLEQWFTPHPDPCHCWDGCQCACRCECPNDCHDTAPDPT